MRFWTAEFSDCGVYVLKPRRVEVVDEKHALGFFSTSSGHVSLIFKDALKHATDRELLDFLTQARTTMIGWSCRLRYYQGMMNELEFYELTVLAFRLASLGNTIDDMKFSFSYGSLRHVYVT